MGRRPAEILLIDAAPRESADIARLLAERGIVAHRHLAEHAGGFTGHVAAAIVVVGRSDPDDGHIQQALDHLSRRQTATIVWGALPRRGTHHPCLLSPPSASAAEVVGQLEAACTYAPMIAQLERELNRLDRCAKQVARHVEQIDGEMRLAGRLQHDFLPKAFPQAPPLRFAKLYRPATWVSGDMLDVFRVDEEHIAIFIADAMGHGTAAALMTMFMRKAVLPVQDGPNGRTVRAPADVIAGMNEAMTQLNFSSTQLMTAAYGLINQRTLEFRLARGGHPYPIVIRRNGAIEEMQPGGALLGIADLPDEFEQASIRLAPGDEVVLYTDGLEDLFIRDRQDQPDGTSSTTFADAIADWSGRGAQAFVDAASDYLDHQEGSLAPDDDMSIVAFDIAPAPGN